MHDFINNTFKLSITSRILGLFAACLSILCFYIMYISRLEEGWVLLVVYLFFGVLFLFYGLGAVLYKVRFEESEFVVSHFWKRRYRYTDFDRYSHSEIFIYQFLISYIQVTVYGKSSKTLMLFPSLLHVQSILDEHWVEFDPDNDLESRISDLSKKLTIMTKNLESSLNLEDIFLVISILESYEESVSTHSLNFSFLTRPKLKKIMSRKWDQFPELKARILTLESEYRKRPIF